VLTEKLARLEEILRSRTPLLVAYSGGVDSTCLLAAAHRTLGEAVTGIIADSPSLPRQALAEALEVADRIGARVEVVTTQEFEDERYVSNPVNRCYFCKSELFLRMDELARSRGAAALAYGENADDPAHLRPGSQAAAEFAVIAPLKAAGLTKADVRELSRQWGLPTADAPAQPCLSSRIPHGTPVTRAAIELVERGEAFLKAHGFRVFRVRYLPAEKPGARVQVAPDELASLFRVEETIRSGLHEAGFASVELDPDGYRGTVA
jgi:uncharacterized protein